MPPTFSTVATALPSLAMMVFWLPSVYGADDAPHAARELLKNHCVSCHEGVDAEGGLDLIKLSGNLQSATTTEKWVRIIDRVAASEMPPPEDSNLSGTDRKSMVNVLGGWVREFQAADYSLRGRVRGRRLTNLQLERSLQDLLGVDIPLARRMPDEPRTDGFTTVADGQSMSHFQLQQHLDVVDAALDEAFRRLAMENDQWERQFTSAQLARRNPRRRTREPELLVGNAVTWSGGPIFYGRLPATTVREDGWYRFTIRAKALNKPEKYGVWCTVRSGYCISSAPQLEWLGAFEANDEFQESTFIGWLPRGHMLEVRPGDLTLKRARFAGGQVGTGEGGPQNVPGVAIESLKMERIHLGPDVQRIGRLLFNELQVNPSSPKNAIPASRYRGNRQTIAGNPRFVVATTAPKEDAAQLVRRFAHRAFRRPVEASVIKPYVQLAWDALAGGDDFAAAVRGAYRALLCSPRFLYLYEDAGKLDDFALASRMSYMLWSRPPDWPLRLLANQGKLRDPAVFRQQIKRMLEDPRGKTFVQDFAAQWLDLSLIDFTEPDRRLYPGFDVIVQQSMLEETHHFLQAMLDNNEPVSNLIDSDSTFLNNRLARHYGIFGVKGAEIRKVRLNPSDHRGGVLTHGAILKVTANGTTTSPVIRGVWISERLLGQEAPPPPANVPAIEPDIRGATSIRDQLARHKSDAACASCHVKIDPPGFALENFDPAGRWREKYGRPGRNEAKRQLIDPSSELPDGRPFKDLREFKALIVEDQAQLTRNLVARLLTYGTGAPVSFADRDIVEDIVRQADGSQFGFRSILYAVMESSIFQTK